ncbi:MAG TPA: ferredoxin family protein [archaeon]|nr:ferredoxin family protein [archaeon]
MIGPRIKISSCKGCGLCIDFCPFEVLGFSEGINQRGVQYAVPRILEKCSGCGICYTICPDAAIEVAELEPETSRS